MHTHRASMGFVSIMLSILIVSGTAGITTPLLAITLSEEASNSAMFLPSEPSVSLTAPDKFKSVTEVHEECTDWARKRARETGWTLPSEVSGVAKDWNDRASEQGLKVGTQPMGGSIFVWEGTGPGTECWAGHVGFVEEVYPDGSATVSETNWDPPFGGKKGLRGPEKITAQYIQDQHWTFIYPNAPTLFEGSNYTGKWRRLVGFNGDFQRLNFEETTIGTYDMNDKISSIWLPPRWNAIMYEHSAGGGQGQAIRLDCPQANFAALAFTDGLSIDEKISSASFSGVMCLPVPSGATQSMICSSPGGTDTAKHSCLTPPRIRVYAPQKGDAKLVVGTLNTAWYPLLQKTVTLDANGWSQELSLDGITAGTYSLYLKTRSRLGKRVVPVTLTANGTVQDIAFPVGLLGDANGDNKINTADFKRWQEHWEICRFVNPADPVCSGPSDFNMDGKVDIVDYSIWRQSAVDSLEEERVGDGWPPTAVQNAQESTRESAVSDALLLLDVLPDSLGVGEPSKIEVWLQSLEESDGVDFIIRYDPGVLQILDSDPSIDGIQIEDRHRFDDTDLNRVFPEEGLIWFSTSTQDYPVTGMYEVADVHFQAVASITNTAVLLYYFPGWTVDTNVLDHDSDQDLLQMTYNDSLAITGSPARVVPSVSVTATAGTLIHSFDTLLEAQVIEPYSQTQAVHFYAFYDGIWNHLGSDADASDGWTWEWDNSNVIDDQTIWLRASAEILGGTTWSSPSVEVLLDRTMPDYVSSVFEPPSPGSQQVIYTWVQTTDNLSGVSLVDMYYNEAPDGSTEGRWQFVGAVEGSSGWIQWDASLVSQGSHRVAFVISDMAGNYNYWSAPDLPVLTYEFYGRVFLPLMVKEMSMSGTCIPAHTLECGETESHAWNNSFPGSTDYIDSYPCQENWHETGPEYTYTFAPETSTTATASLSNLSEDLDVFVLMDFRHGCESWACITSDNSTVTFSAVAGQKYYIVVDGYQGAVSDYNLSLTCNAGQ